MTESEYRTGLAYALLAAERSRHAAFTHTAGYMAVAGEQKAYDAARRLYRVAMSQAAIALAISKSMDGKMT